MIHDQRIAVLIDDLAVTKPALEFWCIDLGVALTAELSLAKPVLLRVERRLSRQVCYTSLVVDALDLCVIKNPVDLH